MHRHHHAFTLNIGSAPMEDSSRASACACSAVPWSCYRACLEGDFVERIQIQRSLPIRNTVLLEHVPQSISVPLTLACVQLDV